MDALKNKFNLVMIITSLILISFAFIRVHVMIKTTELGYEIAKLKDHEETLLEQRSDRKMVIAKLTSRSNLNLLSQHEIQPLSKSTNNIASK